MSLQEALYSQLTGHAGLTALMGSGDDARFYPGVLPQNTPYPALYYRLEPQAPVLVMGGESGLTSDRVELHLFDTDNDRGRLALKQLVGSSTVEGALQNWSGVFGDTTVQAAYRQTGTKLYEEGPQVHHWLIPYNVWYVES